MHVHVLLPSPGPCCVCVYMSVRVFVCVCMQATVYTNNIILFNDLLGSTTWYRLLPLVESRDIVHTIIIIKC